MHPGDIPAAELEGVAGPGDEPVMILDGRVRYPSGGARIYRRHRAGGGAVVWWHPGDVFPAGVEMDRLPTTTLREVRALGVMPLPHMLIAILHAGHDEADVADAAVRILEASGVIAHDLTKALAKAA